MTHDILDNVGAMIEHAASQIRQADMEDAEGNSIATRICLSAAVSMLRSAADTTEILLSPISPTANELKI